MINCHKDLLLQIVEKFQGKEDMEKLLSTNETMENTVANPEEFFNVERETIQIGK